jgi:hypothetical protein
MEKVSARIRYLNPDWRGRKEIPRIDSRDSRRSNTRFYDVQIEDARPLQASGALDLDTNGFVLMPHATQVRDFGDAAEIRRTYYPEVKALLRQLTGADDLAILHHVIRREDASEFNAAYARYVHCDFSEARARDFSHRLMLESGLCTARETGKFDFAWYNTWQPIEREVQKNPLTLIDTRTVRREDFYEYVFDEDGVASMPLYSSDHRHYYFPRMQTSELLVFKQLDSRTEQTSLCAHTSFDDSTSPDDAPRRRSIEVRFMCVFARG